MLRYDNFYLGVPCRHKFRVEAAEVAVVILSILPSFLCLKGLVSHWWLVQTLQQDAKPEIPTSFVGNIRRIQEEFEEGTSYRQHVILDHLYVLPDAEVFNPCIQHDRVRPVGVIGHQLFGH